MNPHNSAPAESEPEPDRATNDGPPHTDQFVDEVAGWILDRSDVDPPAVSHTAPGGRQELTTVELQRLGDVLWVNALLEHSAGSHSRSCERNIHMAMRRIVSSHSAEAESSAQSQPAATTSPLQPAPSIIGELFPRRRRTRAAWLVAFLVLIATGVWVQLTDTSRQAFAAVEMMEQVAAELKDRQYRLTVGITTASEQGKSAIQERLVGDLYVRGGEAFACSVPGVLGAGRVWFGGTPEGVWLKPARGPIVFESSAQGLLQLYLRQPLETPYLQITTVLERLKTQYNVKLLADQIPPGDSAPTTEKCRLIQGTRKGNNPALPRSIEVWSDRRTGNVMRLVMNWERISQPGMFHVEFNYVRQSELPDNWYRPDGHPKGKL